MIIFTSIFSYFRYLAVCHPISYRASLAETSSAVARAAKFVAPAVGAAFVLNVPKFLEIEVTAGVVADL